MKPLYRILLIVGMAMGVVATTLIIGVGQAMIMHMQSHSIGDEDVYAVYEGDSGGWTVGMPLDLAREIRSWLPDDVVAAAVSFDQHDAEVRIGSEFYGARVVGVDAEAHLLGLEVVDGRFFTREDQEHRKRVCVVTADLLELFGREALRSISVNSREYEVIGTAQGDLYLAGLPLGIYSESSIFFPLEVWYEDFNAGRFHDGLIMQLGVFAPGYSKADLSRLISQNLIHMEDAPALKVASPGDRDNTQWAKDLLVLTGIFLVAFIVFLLAGLNIIQIASANVYDQQRVFGLKVALGALPKHLAREVMGEIAACALQGGYLGIVLAGIVNTVMNSYVGMYWAAFNLVTVVSGVLLALLVGWITAVVPARQAAKIDPVAVLRPER